MSTEHTETHRRPEQTTASGKRPPLMAMMANVWGMGVVLGPTLVLNVFAAASTLAVVSGRVFKRREGLARLLWPLAVLGAILPWSYMLFIRPWLLRWGATDEEVEKPLPGDELVPEPRHQSTRAITVNAPVEEVWPWLAQVGQGRGGFYSYEWLENLSGAHIRSAHRIHPEWQHREAGDIVWTSPSFGFKVEAFEPGRAIVLEHWGAFCVEPIDQNRTRVILRTRAPRGLGGMFYHPLVGEFPHFVMERGMLKGIKRRAERNMNVPNGIMDGKVVLVTGGTGGIGKDIAQGLASMGANLVVVGHDRSKGEAAAAEIKASSGNEAVELMVADLSSQAEIHRLVREFEAHYDRLDVLVNNAGGLYLRRWETAEGIEGTLAVIHFAPVLLTNLLLPMLQRSAPSRIVNVSSWSHRWAKLNLDDLQMREHYSPRAAYSRAKLINLLWTYELARRLEGTEVTINLADPGGASTEMTRSEAMPWIFRTINRLGRKVMTTEKAARVSIYLASSPEVEGVNRAYFDNNSKQIKSSKASYDEEAQKRIWEVSAELAKLDRRVPVHEAARTR
jgi:NAD(P)-dependent dehydrogenase (short-subunit alcohol dehydrogenase family)